MMLAPRLKVEDLAVGIGRRGHVEEIVHGVSFSVAPGEIVAIVGGTGSGKTLTARALMGLLPPGAFRLRGTISFEGTDLSQLTDREYQAIRLRRIAMIVQNAPGALHPLRRVGDQMVTLLRDHKLCVSRDEAFDRVHAALASVNIPDARGVASALPHELSGGMAQRVIIAIALLAEPRLLIADEPTTGLDTTVQAQVMELIVGHARGLDASTLLVTHDLGVVAQHCERAIVLENGCIVEDSSVLDLFRTPMSEYGRRLVDAAKREATAMHTSSSR